MRIPVIIEITDKHRQGNNAPVIVRILAADTRLPFLQFECGRLDLHNATEQRKPGAMNSDKIDGHLTTKET